jgi:23S rRNA pseudouridine2605 synthase
LMHPRFEVEREYAVRVQGTMTEAQMDQALKHGVELEDGLVKFEKLDDEGGEGYNHWYRVMLKEGRNRVVRRTFDALGLPVSRLMRVRFGIINLPPRLKRGMTAELGEGEVAQVLDWAGITTGSGDTQHEFQDLERTDRARSEPAVRQSKAVARTGRSTNPAGARKSKAGVKR